ncbi:hypothetical protein TRAPUB_9599 [Trametes pubescens]|uniref:F-box domain-containing protein n=1 Tax=Trametes pubescens TaxID=154538 RepID=A0A1M2W1T8_TRAPU|nr:hypothetical protein TRAPUB_9599 [Trametes pubescens]
MAYATLESPLARAPTTMSWTSEYSEPPPYDMCDTPTLASAAGYTDKTALPFSRPSASGAMPPPLPRAPWPASPRRSAANLSIPHLREALHSLESKMARLLNERDRLEARLEQAVRLQSPVQRVPNDLLSSIFTIAVLDGEEEDSITLSNLMLVCQYWREVAIHTPMLWTRIAMGTHRSVDRALLKLDRSKTAPLYISLDFSPRMEHGTVSTENIITAMDLIQPAIWRWKTFHLTVPSRPQAHIALTRCKEQAPLLEVLSIRVAHSMQEDHYSTPPLPLFERHMPRLRSTSFTSFNFNWDLSLLSNLRVLKLGGYWNGFSPSVDVILKTLRSCPLLEELVLRNMSDVDPESCAPLVSESSTEQDDYAMARVSDTRTIHLPRLRRASFYYSGNLRTRTVFSLLSFPALERIELCYLDNVSPILESLRKQSLTVLPLRHLRIESCFLNELRFARLLPRLPALNSLELVDVEDVTPNLMRNFATPPVSQTWVCPKLATLSLEGCTSIDWETLRSIVESRLPPHSRAFPRQAAQHEAAPVPRPAVSMSSASASSQRPVASSSSSSSASAFAATAYILAHQPSAPAVSSSSLAVGRPVRLESMDLTRCHQISKEMVQWLRMYVAEVKCETVKSVWGEPSAS